jgi:hypothetical protein
LRSGGIPGRQLARTATRGHLRQALLGAYQACWQSRKTSRMFRPPPISAWLHALKPYERHISAVAMAGGFAFDNVTYGRVDHPVTQTLLIVYLGIAGGAIVLLHYVEAHQQWQSRFVNALRSYLPALTQFVLGSLWSAFLVFYARSGVLAASWPFLIMLAAVLIGNEVFKKYHARLIFTTTLFFFALLSYAVFMVPVFTHTIGQLTFILSGVAAVVVFAGFLWLLSALSVAQLGEVKWKIVIGATAVYAVISGLYFLNVLPPLPLAMQQFGVYQSICRIPPRGAVRCVGASGAQNFPRTGRLYYLAAAEPQSWLTWLGVPRVVHVAPGAPVVVFGAIFAPVNLDTSAYHIWQRYDDAHGIWRTVQRVDMSMHGGREQGYRGYSYKTSPDAGLWRVDFRTVDDRLIGRTTFTVQNGPPGQPVQTVKL